MLAVSSAAPLRRVDDEEILNGAATTTVVEDFADVLESIDFDDLFDVLPDLEMDPDMLAEFCDESELTSSVTAVVSENENTKREDGVGKAVCSDSGTNSGSSSKGEEIVSNKEGDKNKGRKSSSKNNNPEQRKKKVKKVDWTPELHRRFVQAVEQLGVDKAVPSRILEIMGIHCLTRHNIASHLQKYRSHRKHLLAREAEAANWSQRRQHLFGGRGGKREVSPWLAPPTIIGFPPMTPPPPTPLHHFRPLHVWGHPTMDQSFMHMWPKPSHPPPPAWPAPSSSDPSYWHHPQHQRVPNALTPGTPCFPHRLTTTRFASPTVAGMPPPPGPPHAATMYKVDPGIGVPPARKPPPRPLFDFHPSKESVDAAIGDVLSKPWLPLPLGLKAPALDSVMGELQRQGIPKIPPSCA